MDTKIPPIDPIQRVRPALAIALAVVISGQLLAGARAQSAASPVQNPAAPVAGGMAADATAQAAQAAQAMPGADANPAGSPGGTDPLPAAPMPARDALWTPVPGQRTVTLNLRQMGAWSPPRLSGVAFNRYLAFNVRPDEVVVGATLKLGYDYSPALLPDLSHLVVALNGSNVALVSTPQQGRNLGNLREIPIDPALFRDRNELLLGFIGHYTRFCEDPFHSSLWMTISDRTRLELAVAPARPGIVDLKQAHLLFLQKDSPDPQTIPVVFGGASGFGTYKAAGIVASWLGAESGARNTDFRVVNGQLPPTNAIVMVKSGENVAGIGGGQSTTISLRPNPANPDAKLLVLSGADDNALQRAARALALTQRSMSGQQVTINNEVLPPERKPYDAPAWLPLNRPVKFGEIAKAAEMNVSGYFPGVIRVNYRVAPDLFAWRTQGVPITVRYRNTDLPSQQNSALNIALNRHMLQSIALNTGMITNGRGVTSASAPRLPSPTPVPEKNVVELIPNSSLRSTSFNIPAYALNGRDQLQLAFSFDVLRRGICQDLPPDNLMGAIDSESVIDFSGFPHYAAMPNLEHFASLGFPFTRLADLAETAVVMPERPNPQELSVYLSAMSLMGESTGYPVLRHEIVTSGGLDAMSGRDLLVIGSGGSQDLLSRWAEQLPLANAGGERRLREVVRSWRPVYRWEQRDIDETAMPAASINLAGAGTISVLMGIESPLKSGRSVVFLYADRAEDLPKLARALGDPERWPQIRGDFALVDDRLIETAKVTPTYYIGSLSPDRKLRWFLQDQPMLVGLIGLLAVILLAALGYWALRVRRRP